MAYLKMLGGIATVDTGISLDPPVTPADLTGNVTAYDGSGVLQTASIWRQGADQNDRIIHSLASSISKDGRLLFARNTGSSRIILAHDSATESTAALRFTFAGNRNFLWYPGQSIVLAYHNSRWRLHGTHYQPRITTPSSISTTQTDWLAADGTTGDDVSICDVIRASCSTPTIISSLGGQYDWREVDFCNVGSNMFILPHEDTSGTAAMRFAFENSLDRLVAPGAIVPLIYDPNASRWKAKSPNSPLVVRKASDESRTSTTTNSNDAALVTPTLPINTLFRIKLVLRITATAAAAGFKAQWSIPSGATINGIWLQSNATPAVAQASSASVNVTTAANITANNTAIFEGTIAVGGTAGVANLSWAQVASSANAVTIKAGSYLELQKM